MAVNAWDELLFETKRSDRISAIAMKSRDQLARPWPPVMIRDFLRIHASEVENVSPDTSIGEIVDFLAYDPKCVVTVTDCRGHLLGTVVDDDVMALVIQHGARALEWPVVEAMRPDRPICSVTESPYMVLHDMLAAEFDRFAVAERGNIIGVVLERDLIAFAGD